MDIWTPHPADQATTARIERADHTAAPTDPTAADYAAALADRGWWS